MMIVTHNPFEQMLAEHQKLTRPLAKKDIPKPLKATQNASLEDFIAMLAEVCSKAMKPWQAELNPNEGAVLKDDDKVIIEQVDPDGQTRIGRTWSQRFSCVIQFNIVASDYSTANAVMTTLEDTIFTYTGYFKSKGVAELIFKRHFTDKNYDRYRQWLSVRSLQYDIEIEKLITVFDTTIEEISI